MAIVNETETWGYSNILNKSEQDREEVVPVSGLKTTPMAVTYSDPGTMDVKRLLNNVPYSFSEKIHYINMSKKNTLYIRKSNLNVCSVSPITNIFNFSKEEVDPPEQLVIVEDYVFGDTRSALESLHLMELSRADSSDEIYIKDRQLICDDLRQVVKNLSTKKTATYYPENPVTLRFTRCIPLRDIRSEGILYLVNMDITVSLDRRMCLDPFPGRVSESDKVDEGKGYELSIDIVDNNDLISTKYIKGVKDIVRIPIIKNPLLSNSVRMRETINGEVVNSVISDLSIESLNSHGIYSSKEEALTSQDPITTKLVSSLEKAREDHKEAIKECNETISGYKDIVEKLEKEVAALKRQIRIMEDTAEDVPVTQTDWSGVFGDSLENVGKFASTASKAADLISKLSKFKR